VSEALSAQEKRSVLLVTDQLPFPPRNGVTLPTYNYAVGLMAHRSVRLLLLADEAAPVSPSALAENEAIFGPIPVVYLGRKQRAARIVDEMRGRDMYNQGWECRQSVALPESHHAESLLASPFSAVAKWEATGLDRNMRFRSRLAAVNDCTAAEYYYRRAQSFGSLKLAVKGLLDRARSHRIAAIEAKSLQRYHHVLMQTPKDVELMRRLVSEQVAERAMLAPNGVRADFFEISPSGTSNTAVFVAELSSEYAPVARWLVTEVWPRVMAHNPARRLSIVGRGASPALVATFEAIRGVSYVEFAPDLGALYSQAAIALSPVFKGYGLINKTIEAMASGVPVIGGVAAFNGIRGFESGRHGMVCRPGHTEDFVAAIGSLMGDASLRSSLSINARALIANQFRWETTISMIERLIDDEQRTFN
jgi:glycosyltransferase involved in cell wall biosynthesis